MSRLELQPISYAEACEFVRLHHRHNKAPQGWKFGMAVNDGERVVGVAMIGRPVARFLDNGYTIEVNRLCVREDAPKNVPSMLYGAAWRAAKALGYKRLITYTLASESGGSLQASGWRVVYETRPQSWERPNRLRVDKHTISQRRLWEAM